MIFISKFEHSDVENIHISSVGRYNFFRSPADSANSR